MKMMYSRKTGVITDVYVSSVELTSYAWLMCRNTLFGIPLRPYCGCLSLTHTSPWVNCVYPSSHFVPLSKLKYINCVRHRHNDAMILLTMKTPEDFVAKIALSLKQSVF